MKSKIELAAIAAALLLGACSPDPEPISGILNCNLDGDYWESTAASAVISNGVTNITGQITSSGQTITMTLQGTTATTYTLTAGGTHAAAYVPDQSGSAAYTSNATGGSGNVTITEINTSSHTMSGIFDFVGARPSDGTEIEITDGIFTDIPYTEEVTQTFNNTFTAKVDGATFNPTIIYGQLYSGKISITGSENGSFPSIGLSVPSSVTPGTYSLSPYGSYNGLYNVANNANSMYSAASGSGGTVTITAHNTTDDTIEGTFQFTASPNIGSTATNSYAITEGTFAVEY
ncbi:MAG: hypothetical protein HYZ14_07600 [Bacteroidetes bacterium]|nr:hypothetical protein [Bacteroidota bacterium]